MDRPTRTSIAIIEFLKLSLLIFAALANVLRDFAPNLAAYSSTKRPCPYRREIHKPFASDKMKFGRPDMGAHRAVWVFAPDRFRLDKRQFAQRWRLENLDAVVSRNAAGEIIEAVAVPINPRIGALRHDGIAQIFGSLRHRKIGANGISPG